jgi:hypothetical protein
MAQERRVMAKNSKPEPIAIVNGKPFYEGDDRSPFTSLPDYRPDILDPFDVGDSKPGQGVTSYTHDKDGAKLAGKIRKTEDDAD